MRDFRTLAWKVLVISFVPDIALAVQHWFGGGWPEGIALMLMHTAVWATCVTLLTTFAVSNNDLSNVGDA